MVGQIMRGAVLALAFAVTACSEDAVEPAPESDDGRLASGEVLEGSISDAMIPLDQLRSQAPPLREEPSVSEGGAPASAVETEGEASEEPVPEAASAEPAPAIAAEPVIDLAPAPAPAE